MLYYAQSIIADFKIIITGMMIRATQLWVCLVIEYLVNEEVLCYAFWFLCTLHQNFHLEEQPLAASRDHRIATQHTGEAVVYQLLPFLA